MNEKTNLPADDDARFHRLVDGECTGEEYRQMLAGLDEEPGGWRRCALAFLESQALERDLSAARREVDLPPVSVQPADFARSYAWGTWLAIAASFLLALGLGISLRGWPLFTNDNLVDNAAQPTKAVRSQPDGLANDRRSGDSPLGNLTLVVDGAGGARDEAINLPIFDARTAAERLSFEHSALPPDVRKALERTGHRIESRQGLVPVVLQDGRQVVFPVEQFQIVPAARRPY
jgi:hypothetical protein